MILQESKVAEIVQGEARGSFVLRKISIDSRTLRSGETFLALKGKNCDGHDFILQAIENNCNAIILSEDYFYNDVSRWLPIFFEKKFYNFIIVKDTYKALVDIAKYTRKEFKGKVIGITGSVGKTTTKELMKHAFREQCKVSANIGNLNNHIGLPLSICNIDTEAEIGIFEMGMNSSGEIDFLSDILKPDIAVITDVSEAHSEFFDSMDAIADAKIEILNGMDKKRSLLFLNKDNSHYQYLENIAVKKGYNNIFNFSLKNKEANCYSEDYKIRFKDSEDFGALVLSSIFGKIVDYKIFSIGEHHILLANLVLAVASKLELDLSNVAVALSGFKLDRGRGKIKKVMLSKFKNEFSKNTGNGDRYIQSDTSSLGNLESDNVEDNKTIILIDDSYNASPKSMYNAIANLKNMDNKNNVVLVLGDMLELGEDRLQQHLKLYEVIDKLKPTLLITLGDNMQKLAELTTKENKDINVKSFTSYLDAIIFLKDNLVENLVVFIKGSYGSNAHLVAKAFY